MAKMKVHELAKEIGKQSKDVIAFLQDKGIEVKAAQSSLEEDAVSMVRKEFGAAPVKSAGTVPNQNTGKAEEKSVQMEKEDKIEKKIPEARAEEKTEQPKKKKKIIFVSNPHNSSISGQRQKNNDKRPAQSQKSGGNGNRQQGQGKERRDVPHKIIKPLTAPTMPEAMQVDVEENARKLVNERLA